MIRMFAVTALLLGACGGTKIVINVRPDPVARVLAQQKIERLSQEIEAWSLEIGSTRPPSSAVCAVPPPNRQITSCEQPVEPTKECSEVCGLTEHICENAEDICSIAEELEGDRWAANQCVNAKKSCRRAQKRCCDCEEKHR